MMYSGGKPQYEGYETYLKILRDKPTLEQIKAGWLCVRNDKVKINHQTAEKLF